MSTKQFRLVKIGCLLAVLMGAPVLAGAMDHSGMAGMDHSGMKDMDHSGTPGMGKDAKMIKVGEQLQNGVKGTAQLSDIAKAMAGMGQKATHHFMVTFTEEKGGKGIGEGLAAVKVTDPAGVSGEANKMTAMDGSFGVDLTLAKPGKYLLEVGTQLADGKKRQFRFEYTVK